MARRTALGLLGSGTVALLGGCRLFGGGSSYRFKMTVEVETPEGLKTGSSVYEMKALGSRDLITGGKGSRTELRGEALAVDLPNGKILFALLKTINNLHDLQAMSMRAMDPAFNYDRLESAKRISADDGIHSPAEVMPSDYPLLVTFRDLNDPKSVERVDPTNFAARFGAGFKLKRITITVTDDAVTTGIEKRLTWLPGLRGTLKPNPPRTMDDPSDADLRLLDTGPFSTELHK